MKKKTFWYVIVIILMILACLYFLFRKKGGNAPAPQPDKAPELVTFSVANGPYGGSLDPAYMTGAGDIRLYDALFEGFFSIDAESGKPVPALAESWKVSDDGKEYTFSLRKNAVWSDGKSVTAWDVLWSWLRELDPRIHASSPDLMTTCIVGAKDYHEGKTSKNDVGLRALDDHTFQIELNAPYPYIPELLTNMTFAVLPRHVIETYGDKWQEVEHFVGNGPFKLSALERGVSFTCLKNPKYWNASHVGLDKLVFLLTSDANAAYTMYLGGTVDWDASVPVDILPSASMREDYQKIPAYATSVVDLSSTHLDTALREILSQKADRSDTPEWKGAWALVPETPGYQTLSKPTSASVDKVAGQVALTVVGQGNEATLAQVVQNVWKKELNVVEGEEVPLWTVKAQYHDPSAILKQFSAGENALVYAVLLAETDRMENGPDRMDALRYAEDLLVNQDRMIIPLGHPIQVDMIDTKRWGGWYPNDMGRHPLGSIFKK